MKNLLTV